jgi:phosphate transport system permease protein
VRPRSRRWFSIGMTVLTGLTILIVLAPLLSILYQAISIGGPAVISPHFFTGVPGEPCSPRPGVTCQYGGIGPSIEGTLALLAVASAIAIPIGLAAAIYVVEYGGDRPVARVISSAADILSGVPSIVAGLFIFALLDQEDPAIVHSAYAGGLALSFLMLPIVTRTTEEALRTVPNSLREAATALGISRWKATLRITLIAALPGILTGVLLSVARAAGESAPLLFTAFGSLLGFYGFDQPTDALPLLIFRFAPTPYDNWIALAWGAALILLLLVLILSVASRLALDRMERRLRGVG